MDSERILKWAEKLNFSSDWIAEIEKYLPKAI